MDFEVTPDDIDSKEKHDAFTTLFGEEAHEKLTAEEEEDELPEGEISRSAFEDLSPKKKKEFVDGGGRIVND